MCVARHGDRSFIPSGIFRRQNASEDHRFDVRRFEMGRKREAVRTGANDGDLASIIPSAHDVSVP